MPDKRFPGLIVGAVRGQTMDQYATESGRYVVRDDGEIFDHLDKRLLPGDKQEFLELKLQAMGTKFIEDGIPEKGLEEWKVTWARASKALQDSFKISLEEERKQALERYPDLAEASV